MENTTNKTPIEYLKLDTRAYNALLLHGIETIEDLETYTPEEIFNLRRMGRKSLSHLQKRLMEFRHSGGI